MIQSEVINYLRQICRSVNPLVVLGDFNLPNINRSNPGLTKLDMLNNYFLDAIMDEIGLYWLVAQLTRQNIFDLAFVTCPNNVYQCCFEALLATSDHSSISLPIIIDISETENAIEIQKNIKFGKVNNAHAFSLLGSVDWRSVFADCGHVDDYVEVFMHIIDSMLMLSFPEHRFRPNKLRSLMSRDARRLILKKTGSAEAHD